MEMKILDVVYCVKQNLNNSELRYSLRSLANLPHNRVFIFGYIPDWVQNVEARPVVQKGKDKWEKTADCLWYVVNDKDLGEEFIMFNDDFFVMKPQTDLKYYYDKTLRDKVSGRAGGEFSRRLLEASKALEERGKSTLNYELHIPIIVNKDKLKKIWDIYPNIGAKRSLYANEYGVKGEQRADCKIYRTSGHVNLDVDFLSTTDGSFQYGTTGAAIKQHFNQKCKYER